MIGYVDLVHKNVIIVAVDLGQLYVPLLDHSTIALSLLDDVVMLASSTIGSVGAIRIGTMPFMQGCDILFRLVLLYVGVPSIALHTRILHVITTPIIVVICAYIVIAATVVLAVVIVHAGVRLAIGNEPK
jgi:hypothetical protein